MRIERADRSKLASGSNLGDARVSESDGVDGVDGVDVLTTEVSSLSLIVAA